MARSKVVEFDYYQFIGLLRRATDAGKRIDKADTERWASYVKSKGINEVAATAIEGQDTDGLYFYSKNDEGCLRLQTIE
jgi:4-hydroxyphenylpyruvate dioxygenase-like putative hemolysin